MTTRKPPEVDVMDLIREREGLRPKGVGGYIYGMYTLDTERDMINTRNRLLNRWSRGIDRPMLREYKILYWALGQLLRRVGEG